MPMCVHLCACSKRNIHFQNQSATVFNQMQQSFNKNKEDDKDMILCYISKVSWKFLQFFDNIWYRDFLISMYVNKQHMYWGNSKHQ